VTRRFREMPAALVAKKKGGTRKYIRLHAIQILKNAAFTTWRHVADNTARQWSDDELELVKAELTAARGCVLDDLDEKIAMINAIIHDDREIVDGNLIQVFEHELHTGDLVVRSCCQVDLTTCEVFDAHTSDVDGVGHLLREYVTFADGADREIEHDADGHRRLVPIEDRATQ